MLSLQQLALYRGGRKLFEDVSITIFPGWKVGLVGANGSGKSSLFSLLLGELTADAGNITYPSNWVMAHVAQETPALPTPAIDFVLAGDAELQEITEALHAAEQAKNGTLLAELHARFEAIDGYTARARASQLMDGLCFAPAEIQRPVAEFSGGWRVRLNVARALMCRSDLLLLDEPTNHLDLDAVLWLEQWLRSYPGTLLLISHDRDVLDQVTDHIAHIEQQHVTLYTGDYSTFETQRASQLILQQAAYEKQQREIAHLEHFITRFRAKATKARQAQSRVKALERMEKVAAAHVDSPFQFAFPAPTRLPNPLFATHKMAAGYADQRVLDSVNLTIQPGTRLGLLGPNGAGKSTLIKVLAGTLQPLSGRLEKGHGLHIGYFAQHQLEQLRPHDSPIAHLQAIDPQATESALRSFIGGFGFSGDRALMPTAPFSGGEKARLALALIVFQKPNLLLLDEPTNHLDLEMRHALTMALQAYEGALILVSHDRHLLRTTTDAFLLVCDGRVHPFDGDVEDYRTWIAEWQRAAEARRVGGEGTQPSDKADRAQRQQQSVARKQSLQQVRKLEQQLDHLHAEQVQLNAALAEPRLYEEAQKGRLKDILQAKAQVDQALEAVETAWFAAQESLG